MPPSVERFNSSHGARIYRLPLDVFPGFVGYAHLVLQEGLAVLVDVGSGFGDSNDQLEAGLRAVAEHYGEQVGWETLSHILITHGHIDHFGGLGFVRQRTRAPVGVHELDLRVLTSYEERLTVVARRLESFLIDAGLDPEHRSSVLQLYLVNKSLFSSVPVDFTFEAQGMQVGPLRLVHVPGHCPGQVVILADDILLSADHVLHDTSPHLAPESLTEHTGLGHYLQSLACLLPLSGDVRLTLGGHEAPIEDLPARIADIEAHHRQRLEAVLDLLREPMTTAQVSRRLFPQTSGYHVLLAYEETGTHIEFLAQRGYLQIENLVQLGSAGTTAVVYRRREHGIPPFHLPDLATEPCVLAGQRCPAGASA